MQFCGVFLFGRIELQMLPQDESTKSVSTVTNFRKVYCHVLKRKLYSPHESIIELYQRESWLDFMQ